MDDTISRNVAIEAFDAQYWERINIPISKEIRNAAKATIKKLPAVQTCKDTVSRQAMINALTYEWDGLVTSVFDVVKSLPSVQPERKTGHWIDIPHTFFCKCSECGWINDHDSGFKWCPDCGAMMKEGE